MNLFVAVFVLHFSFCNVKGQGDYKIIAPELICDGSSNLKDAKPDVTTIRLLGDGNLDFKLNFKRTGKKCRNIQRCNLIAWNVIREFEKYLNNYPYTQTNSIDFNNDMLLPGLQYIINIVVTTGKTKEEKQVSLNFVDDTYIRAAEIPLASITLIGAVSVQPHATYVLNAEATVCSNTTEFYFEWELLDESNNIIQKFFDRSSELNIPPFTFKGGKNYNIKCKLINMENNEPIAKNTQTVYVKNREKGLIVKLPMVYTTVEVQQPINIQPYVLDLRNLDGDIKIDWSCFDNNENVCKNYVGSELNIEGGFLHEGEYDITLKATKDSEETSASCIIKVLKGVPSIEIDTIDSPILPSKGVDIKANVYGLRTFCTLQWQSQEGPYFFDLSALPSNDEKLYRVIARRDLFLAEFEEISSDVTNKEFHLQIPPPSEVWQGLPNLDENYKLQFILEAKCPKVQMEDNNIEVEYSEEMLNDTISVTALLEIDVNVAPRLQSLEVEPLTGIALETIFTFKTHEAVKTGDDGPFLYSFGYVLGDREFIFSNMLGFKQSTTVLPYIEDLVKTFVQVCDSFNSCAKTFGPTIETTLPVTINEQNVLAVFKEKLNRDDFYKAFGYGLSVLYTAKKIGDEETYTNCTSHAVLTTIQSLINSDKDDETWSKRTNKLIKYISEFSEEYSFSDDLLNSLVELRSKLLEVQREYIIILRQLLEVPKKTLTDLENFRSYLDVSDLIITRSQDKEKIEEEKEHFDQKVMEYLGKLCIELYKGQDKIVLEFKSAYLVVEKLPKKYFNNFHIIPFEGNPWNTTAELKLNVESLEKIDKEKLCISKTIFKDFFNRSGIIYGANVWNGDNGNLLEITDNTILMPVDSQQVTRKKPKCMVYNNGEWLPKCKFVKLVSKYVQCSCTSLGRFFIEYEENIASTTAIVSKISDITTLLTTKTYSGELTKIVERELTSVMAPTEIITKGIDSITKATLAMVGLNESQPTYSSDVDQVYPSSLTTDLSDTLNSNPPSTTQDTEIVEMVDDLTAAASEASIPLIVTEESALNTKETGPTELPTVRTMLDSNASTIKESELTTLPASKEATMEILSPVPTSLTPTTEKFVTETSTATNTDKIPSVPVTSTPSSRETIVDVLWSSISSDYLTSTTEKRSSVQPTINGNVPDNTSTDNKMTAVQFLTTSLPDTRSTVLTKTITERKPVQSSPWWGAIQGGFQANFNAGFSVGFSLNTTYV